MKRQRQRRIKKRKQNIAPLSNYDILDLAAKLKIPHFHGVFMRDTLLKKKGPAIQECWILNHGSSRTVGTHWTALVKKFNTAFYFDSFGKLAPPFEVLDYLGDDIKLFYNSKRYQNYGSTICGHLCLRFLHDFWQKKENNIKERSPF